MIFLSFAAHLHLILPRVETVLTCVGDQLSRFRGSPRTETGSRGGRYGLLVLEGFRLIDTPFEDIFLDDLLQVGISVLDSNRRHFTVGRMHRSDIRETPFFVFALLVQNPSVILRGEATRLDVPLETVSAPRPGELPRDVLVEVLLFATRHHSVDGYEDDAQCRDEDAGRDELVPHAAASPRDHVVGEQARADEEEAEDQEAHPDVQHADGGGQAVVGRGVVGDLLGGEMVHAVHAAGTRGETSFAFEGPPLGLLPQPSLALDGHGRVEACGSMHLESRSISVFLHALHNTAHSTALALHCTQCIWAKAPKSKVPLIAPI